MGEVPEAAMNIGHFLGHYPSIEGTTNMVNGLSEAMIALGHPQRILTTKRPVEATVPQGVEVRQLEVPSATVLRTMARMHRLPRADREAMLELDVLIVHGMFHRQSLWVARAARSLGVPVVVAPHDGYVAARFGQNGLRKKIYWRMFERGHLARAAAIHVLAPSHERALRARGITAPVFAIPNGLDERTLRAAVSDAPAVVDSFRLAFVGRHDVYNKGIDLLLRAVKRASSERTIELMLVGRASEAARNDIATLSRHLGIESRVHVLGVLDDPRAVVESCHALVLPSRTEGFGLVVLEALATGRPVIVSSGAGASEWFGDSSGVSTAEPQAEALSAAIVTLADNYPSASRQVMLARDELARNFSWTAVAVQWSEALSAATSTAACTVTW
jgi:glycosyltransferase involved in cell wall biosynthesis